MDDDVLSYVSLFGQRVNLPTGLRDNDKGISRMKNLSMKEASSAYDLSGLNSRVTILSLPTEVLMIIFNFLSGLPQRHIFAEHFAHERRGAHSGFLPTTPSKCDCENTWLTPDIYWRSFPYSQERVCTRWRYTLASSPALWTKIVVSRVSGHWTHPREFSEYLRWTKDLPIEVYIGVERDRRAELNGFGSDVISEREMAAQYTLLLRPHLWRCTVIDYHVRYSTSLPSIFHDLSGISACLESLRLVSDEECPPTPHHDPSPGRPFIPVQSSDYPNLETLTLDGANFILASRYLPQLIRSAQVALTIHHYHYDLGAHPLVDDFRFNAVDVLKSLFPRVPATAPAGLLAITFQSVEFFPLEEHSICKIEDDFTYDFFPSGDVLGDHEPNWHRIWLKFIDTSDRLLTDFTFLSNVYTGEGIPRQVELDNCTIRPADIFKTVIEDRQQRTDFIPTPGFPGPKVTYKKIAFEMLPFVAPRIVLRNIKDSESMSNFFSRLGGPDLISVYSCPGFSNEALSNWAETEADHLYFELFDDIFTIALSEFEIADCPNFTPDALYRALECRCNTIAELESGRGMDPGSDLRKLMVEHPTIELDAEWQRKFHGKSYGFFSWKLTHDPQRLAREEDDGGDRIMGEDSQMSLDDFEDVFLFAEPGGSAGFHGMQDGETWGGVTPIDESTHWMLAEHRPSERVGSVSFLMDGKQGAAAKGSVAPSINLTNVGTIPDDYLGVMGPESTTPGQLDQIFDEFVCIDDDPVDMDLDDR